VRVRPQREERELFGLLRSSLSEPLAAVARVDDEQAGEAVEVALAAVIPDVVAFAAWAFFCRSAGEFMTGPFGAR